MEEEQVLEILRQAKERGVQDQLPPQLLAAFNEADARGLLETQPLTPGQIVLGTGETALTFLTGAMSEPVAGLAGLGEGAWRALIHGDDFLDTAANRIRNVQEGGTFQPRSEGGQRVLQTIATPFQILADASQGAGNTVLDATGSPLLATGTQAAIENFPSLLGIRGTRQRRAQQVEGEARTQDIRDTTGVEPGANPRRQGEQIAQSVEQQTGGQTVKGQDLELVQLALQENQQLRQGVVNRLYEEARQTNAAVLTPELVNFSNVAIDAVRNFDRANMPFLNSRLKDLEKIRELPPNSAVSLNALSRFRERLTQNRPPAADTKQNLALGLLRGQLDEFVDAQFNRDMIIGDESAVQKWKDARAEFNRYAEDFKDNKVVRQLWEQAADPDEIKNWIFGASAVGARREAASVVRLIGDLVGRESPAFTALRQEAIFDITKPLMSETPNLERFIRNYDNFVRERPALAKELFPDSVTALGNLRDIASANINVTNPVSRLKFRESFAQAMFGHEIQQATVRKNLALTAIDLMIRAVSPSRQRQIMGEILGVRSAGPGHKFCTTADFRRHTDRYPRSRRRRSGAVEVTEDLYDRMRQMEQGQAVTDEKVDRLERDLHRLEREKIDPMRKQVSDIHTHVTRTSGFWAGVFMTVGAAWTGLAGLGLMLWRLFTGE